MSRRPVLRLVVNNEPATPAQHNAHVARNATPLHVPDPVSLLDDDFDALEGVAVDLAAVRFERDMRDYWDYVPFGAGE